MSSKSERQRSRDAVAAYHEAQLSELLAHVGGAIDRFREGELGALEVDHILFQYSRAARELWKFCNMTDFEMTAELIGDESLIDWWERGTPKERRTSPPTVGAKARG